MLSDQRILEAMEKGDIRIEPFNINQLNPNSYNVKLDNKLQIYKASVDGYILDMKKNNELIEIIIPEEGYVLRPGVLYLGKTVEYTETNGYVPMLDGRSSVGRLGVYIHVTAGFGDNGFSGYWTLEIACIQPVIIYPNTEIGQIFYNTIEGECNRKYKGKYQNNTGIQGSMMYKDFCK